MSINIFLDGVSVTTTDKIFAIIMVWVAIVATVVFALDFADPKTGESLYVLRSQEDTVNLYRDGKLIECYDGISIKTLPSLDRNRLKNGIEFESIDEARRAVEDYDG